MVAQAKKRMSVKKRIFILIGLILAMPIFYIIFYFLTSPVLNVIDKNKFTKHDNQGKSLYAELKAASGGIDDWKYEAKCIDARSGDFPDGNIFCGIDITLNTTVGSAPQFKSLHEKYFNIIDSQKFLKPETDLSLNPPAIFGTSMVKSTAEKTYASTGKITCNYGAEMYDATDKESAYKQAGSEISVSNASVYINFTCSDRARDNWYNSKLY